jgi:hypothetical protein
MSLAASFRSALTVAAVFAVAPGSQATAPAPLRTQGFVVSMFHPATYSQPGNCPRGGNGGERDLERRVLRDLGYSAAATQKLLEGDPDVRRKIVALRGTQDGRRVSAVTYPESVRDPHIELASGKFAYGFDLDGKGADEPGSFVDPESHEAGVDNGLYRVLGCYPTFDHTLPVRPQTSDVFWEISMDSIQPWLFVVSGKNLEQDGEVRVEFYRATQHPSRDRQGHFMADETFVIDRKNRSHGSFHGAIHDGVLVVGPADLLLEGELPLPPEVDLSQARLRLTMPKPGLSGRDVGGWLGGYAPWYSLWFELNQVRGHYLDEAGTYYAFKRLADADPDPASGENRRISATFRIEAIPVFVMSADGALLGSSAGWSGT